MTEEQFNKAKDIRKRNGMLHKLYDCVNEWGMDNRLSHNDAALGYIVRHLICDDEEVCTRFADYLAEEITICNDEFAKLSCDDGTNGDWVSVGFQLPPYEEDVLVCCADEVEQYGYWFSHRSENKELLRDDKQFTIMQPLPRITHWRHITPPKKR